MLTLAVALVVATAIALRYVLGYALGAGPGRLYVVTQRRALVVRSRGGVLELELDPESRFVLDRLSRPKGILVVGRGEKLHFSGLDEPARVLAEIVDARRNVTNASEAKVREQEENPPQSGLPLLDARAEARRQARAVAGDAPAPAIAREAPEEGRDPARTPEAASPSSARPVLDALAERKRRARAAGDDRASSA
jgi:hypothetical protein